MRKIVPGNFCRRWESCRNDDLQYNNPTKAGKYSLEDHFRASDKIPHHYPKFKDDLRFWYFEYCAMNVSYPNSTGFSGLSVRKPES